MGRARVPTKIFLNIIPTALVRRPPGALQTRADNPGEDAAGGEADGDFDQDDRPELRGVAGQDGRPAAAADRARDLPREGQGQGRQVEFAQRVSAAERADGGGGGRGQDSTGGCVSLAQLLCRDVDEDK